MTKMVIAIKPDGTMQFIYKDEMARIIKKGNAKIKRASYVEPKENKWTANLSPLKGPILGPFPLRKTALQEEEKWIQQNVLRKEPHEK